MSNITPYNQKTIIIDTVGYYNLANGDIAYIDTIHAQGDLSTTSFNCKGYRLKPTKRGFRRIYSIWHECGAYSGEYNHAWDIVSKYNGTPLPPKRNKTNIKHMGES